MTIDATSGAISSHIHYDAFGNVKHSYYADESTFSPTYTFSTKEFLEAVNLYLYAYRAYDPESGRWTQRDPIDYQDSINLYQFCGNNPVNSVDEYGLYAYLDKEGKIHVPITLSGKWTKEQIVKLKERLKIAQEVWGDQVVLEYGNKKYENMTEEEQAKYNYITIDNSLGHKAQVIGSKIMIIHESIYTTRTLTHEIGHLMGLSDEYCHSTHRRYKRVHYDDRSYRTHGTSIMNLHGDKPQNWHYEEAKRFAREHKKAKVSYDYF